MFTFVCDFPKQGLKLKNDSYFYIRETELESFFLANQHLFSTINTWYYFIDSSATGAVNGDVEDQPIDDGSKGELIIGPGAGGMQPRPSEVKRALPPLTYQQEEMLKKAKRYAMEQSVQQVGGCNCFVT